jgi:hypothetical protein
MSAEADTRKAALSAIRFKKRHSSSQASSSSTPSPSHEAEARDNPSQLPNVTASQQSKYWFYLRDSVHFHILTAISHGLLRANSKTSP